MNVINSNISKIFQKKSEINENLEKDYVTDFMRITNLTQNIDLFFTSGLKNAKRFITFPQKRKITNSTNNAMIFNFNQNNNNKNSTSATAPIISLEDSCLLLNESTKLEIDFLSQYLKDDASNSSNKIIELDLESLEKYQNL